MSAEYRPSFFSDIVGQDDVKTRLSMQIKSARKRGRALGHILFEGPPGLGKTTLSEAVANEYGTVIKRANAVNLTSPKKLMPIFTAIAECQGAIVFIDEIHRLTAKVCESLYTAMEDFRVDHSDDDSSDSLELKPFCLIGATTEAGHLPRPLQDRFINKYVLRTYSVEELTLLVTKRAVGIGLSQSITKQACEAIAKRSKGVARAAGANLEWVRDYAEATNAATINTKVVDAAMRMSGIDCFGFDVNDRAVLRALAAHTEPVGLNVLASEVNISEQTIADNVEPYLIRLGLVVRGPKGRKGAVGQIKQMLAIAGQFVEDKVA